MNILLVDDCAEVGQIVKHALQPYEVTQAFSIAEARRVLSSNVYDLLLIDIMLPDGDGCEFCNQLDSDSKFSNVPKILLTSRSKESDKVYGLYSGADDYITKPFSLQELKARVDVRLKKGNVKSTALLKFGDLEFNSEFQKCLYQSSEGPVDLGLTPTEYRILLCLVRNYGSPVSRSKIVSNIWKADGLNIELRGIDSHVTHLRKKIKPTGAKVSSVYGLGYCLKWDNNTHIETRSS